VLGPYADFFGLFGDFSGDVDHFLLNDLLIDGSASVRFLKDSTTLRATRCQQAAWPSTAST
jgi:hypothetical protein